MKKITLFSLCILLFSGGSSFVFANEDRIQELLEKRAGRFESRMNRENTRSFLGLDAPQYYTSIQADQDERAEDCIELLGLVEIDEQDAIQTMCFDEYRVLELERINEKRFDRYRRKEARMSQIPSSDDGGLQEDICSEGMNNVQPRQTPTASAATKSSSLADLGGGTFSFAQLSDSQKDEIFSAMSGGNVSASSGSGGGVRKITQSDVDNIFGKIQHVSSSSGGKSSLSDLGGGTYSWSQLSDSQKQQLQGVILGKIPEKSSTSSYLSYVWTSEISETAGDISEARSLCASEKNLTDAENKESITEVCDLEIAELKKERRLFRRLQRWDMREQLDWSTPGFLEEIAADRTEVQFSCGAVGLFSDVCIDGVVDACRQEALVLEQEFFVEKRLLRYKRAKDRKWSGGVAVYEDIAEVQELCPREVQIVRPSEASGVRENCQKEIEALEDEYMYSLAQQHPLLIQETLKMISKEFGSAIEQASDETKADFSSRLDDVIHAYFEEKNDGGMLIAFSLKQALAPQQIQIR